MGHKHGRLFHRLFLLMTGMITLLVVLILIIGTVTLRKYIKSESIASNREVLVQKKYLLEHTLENIERTAQTLASDNYFQRFVLLPFNVNERYPVWKDIIDKMNDTINSFGMIDSIYLYPLEKEKSILSDKGVIPRKEFGDRLYLNDLENDDYNTWQQTRSYDKAILSPLSEAPLVMSYLKTVPAQNSTPRGLLVINVMVSSLNKIVEPTDKDDRVLLLSNNGMILIDSQKQGVGRYLEDLSALPLTKGGTGYREIDGREGTDLIIGLDSPRNDWTYYYFAHLPYRAPWLLFARSLLFLTLLFLGLGIIIAYLISSRYTKPWESLINEFIPATEEDELETLSLAIRNLRDENSRYREKDEKRDTDYIREGSGRSLAFLEDKLDRWKNGITLWDKKDFIEQTDFLANEIISEKFLDSYGDLLLLDMARSLIVTLCRRGGKVNNLFREDIIKKMISLESHEDKKQALLDAAEKCKGYLDRNKSHPRDKLVNDMVRFLDEHYGEELYTDAMARRLNLSESYFCRLVKEATGKTFNELLSEIRFREVCRLLKETDDSLDGIAELTGLKSKRNLLRNFKKHRDDTPGRYRQKARLE